MGDRNPFDFSQGLGDGLGDLGLTELGLDGLLGTGPGLEADPQILDKNLIALCARNRELAQRVAATPARAGAVFEIGADGAVTGTLDGRRLGSKRRTLDEAHKLAEAIDTDACAAACVLGFGLGHHVRAIQSHLGMKSVVVVLEPDVALLRAVLERVDHSDWLALGRCMIVTDAEDTPGLTRRIEGVEGIVSLGAQIIEHPASKARLGEVSGVFGRTVSAVVRATRTNIVTTLAHAPVTLRNMLMNADRYASCAGVEPLRGACTGYPAVTVAAGPSLERNLALLGEPGVRDRVVIIAVQTVLKPMLAAGIRPHFVTALDHHELSGRFYEGLTAADVEGVRLVVEPKANPAIFEKFPGETLCIQESVLDELIGEGLRRSMGDLPAGATVAHLSYYLARYLGCDPVIMIGQDLAFTDQQYYSANAAIHKVWQGELNGDRTLEMLEWERVARMRANLHRVAGRRGQSLYADEQMVTYLSQFEADFQKDTQAGMTVIDATEGGATKRHTVEMTLRAALDQHATRPLPELPATEGFARPASEVRRALRAHWETLIGQSGEISASSADTAAKLRRIVDREVDVRGANAIVHEVRATSDRVRAMQPCFRLVEFINQSGVLNRFRADRKIGLNTSDDPVELQRLQAERDVTNVEWIGHAADELSRQVRVAMDVLDGSRDKLTRHESSPESIEVGREPVRAEVVVLCDPERSGTGAKRDLGEPVWRGCDAMALTLGRVLRCRSVRGVRVLTPDAETTRALVERAGLQERVQIEAMDPEAWRARSRAVGFARANAGACWRGGIGQTTVYDEHLDPKALLGVMERHGIDAAAVVGADWAMVDPALIDAAVDRHAESPERNAVTFTQAVPGLGACVLGRAAVSSLVEMQSLGSALGTVGGLLGYVPVNTQTDPIGTALCVSVDPRVRDAGVRVIADAGPGRAMIAAALDRLGERADGSSAVQTVRALGRDTEGTPRSLVLELGPGRIARGVFAAWKGLEPDTDRASMAPEDAMDLLYAHAESRADATVTFDGPGDPLTHSSVLGLTRFAAGLGYACVTLQTDLLSDDWTNEEILGCGAGVITVDLLANDAPTYAALTGVDRHTALLERLGALADARSESAAGLRTPWIVPRMTKCDAVLDQIEGFYDAWTMAVGSAVIDAQPGWVRDRVRPLPVPVGRLLQIERDVLRVRSDGQVCDREWQATGIDALSLGVAEAGRAWREHMARAAEPAGALA